MTQIHMKCYNNGLDDYVFDPGVNVLKNIGSERYPRETLPLTDSRIIKNMTCQLLNDAARQTELQR